MSSLQGEMSKQMSLPSFKHIGAFNRQSHDFPSDMMRAKAHQDADE